MGLSAVRCEINSARVPRLQLCSIRFSDTTPARLVVMSGYSSKRARSSVAAVTRPAKDSLFAAFRSLGHISTSTPFAIQSRSGKFLETPAVTVLTSLGTSWALWEGQSLRLLFVGKL